MLSFKPRKLVCPVCGSAGNWCFHGYYSRGIIDFINGKQVADKVVVTRLLCKSCGHTHAVLPDIAIPYSEYSLLFVLSVLAKAVLDHLSVECICELFNITRNQFYKWKKMLWRHKREWLGALEANEISDETFVKRLITETEYSRFARAFAEKAACSFLQSHRNPRIKRRKAARYGLF